MSDQTGTVHLTISDGIAAVLIDRPEARNAMTWPMYEQLAAICTQIAGDSSIRVATFRGAGGEAFVAGTDIEQFSAFKGGDDGVAYEKTIDQIVGQIEKLPMPTIAIVEGWAIGGGLAICAACDFRVATPEATFGVPIARTLGNCLSMANIARVVAAFGVPRAKRMLLLAETITAGEAESFDFVTEIAEPVELEATVVRMCKRLSGHAAVTMRVSKEAIRRLAQESLPDGEDLIRAAYGSADFGIGVSSFLQKKKPEWTGA